jgi:hypothetical protein
MQALDLLLNSRLIQDLISKVPELERAEVEAAIRVVMDGMGTDKFAIPAVERTPTNLGE